MKKKPFSQAVVRSQEIRQMYHQLEIKNHGTQWSVEEDVLAFMTDAGLVGRLSMANQGRWPAEKGASAHDLEHKIGECIWWLTVVADRMDLDADAALEKFLTKTEQQLTGSASRSPSRPKETTHAKTGRPPRTKVKGPI